MFKAIKAIAIVAASLMSTSVLAKDVTCGVQLFSALTENHKKEVRLCMYNTGRQNVVRYQFGKVGEKPELEVIKPTKEVYSENHRTRDFWFNSLFFNNGNYHYEVIEGQDDSSLLYSTLTVSKGNKELAKIKLDYNSIGKHRKGEYNIKEGTSLTDFGIIDAAAEDDEIPEVTAVAPRLSMTDDEKWALYHSHGTASEDYLNNIKTPFNK